MNPLLQSFLDPGGTLVAWHSGSEPLDPSTMRHFLHVGTERQAISRAGRVLTRLILRPAGARRLKDMAEQDWSPSRLRRLQASGDGYGVYLNRHEGVDIEEVESARNDPRVRRSRGSVDSIPDMLFRRLVPSAHDSLIVVDPALVLRAETMTKTGIGASVRCA